MAFQTVRSHLDSLSGQEIGRRPAFGKRDWLSSSLCSSYATSHVTETAPHRGHDWGAVFGLGFSPDGKILTAACEHRCMMLYDPLNAKLITRRFETHDDCINCVRFLDDRVFATCSDDTTVRLWDSRFLTKELRILRGHSSWVKNIEYSSSSGKLVTSGFDGNIFSWDINNFSTNDCSEPVFYINGALRTKMTTSENKLIVSTLGGYFLLIHDLDLDHLKEDLAGFKPHLYRLMQLMNTPLHHALQYNYMFTRRRNRVEFMCDFPDSDNAESIATMQIHPHDWCVVSRNTTLDEETEWTCVHDIQSTTPTNKMDLRLQVSTGPGKDNNSRRSSESTNGRKRKVNRSSQSYPGNNGSDEGDSWEFFSPMWAFLGSDATPESQSVNTGNLEQLSDRSSSDEDEESEEEDTTGLISLRNKRHEVYSSQAAEERPSSSTDLNPDPSLVLHKNDAPNSSASPFTFSQVNTASPLILPDEDTNCTSTAFRPFVCSRWQRRRMAIVHETSASTNQQQQGTSRPVPSEHLRIRNVKPRLLCYAEEPNVGRGFIKEQSFSWDGRVIASPFGNHVRILAFDKQCHELCDNVPISPRPLVEVSNCALLKSNVLTSTFSPVQYLLAAGGVDGSIAFCHPVL